MLANIILIILTLTGIIIFWFMPEPYWQVGAATVIFSWLIYLVFIFPRKQAQTRGIWAFIACFVLAASIATLAALLYLQAIAVPISFTNESFNLTSYFAARIFSTVVGSGIGLVITLLFFIVVGYFSSIYILAIPEEEGLNFWDIFRSFVSLIFNIQYDWLRIEEGKITEVKEKGYLKSWFSLGKVMIRPGNAVVLERGGNITRICGPGVVVTNRGEKIRGNTVFDLRPQFYLATLENVITSDRISLKIEVGVGYRIRPAADPNATNVIRERNFNVFPVEEETIRRAAFNVNNWRGLAEGAVMNNLRDQIMAHRVDELFTLEANEEQPRVNNRRIRIIELAAQEAINNIGQNLGIEITGVDIRQITLPDGIKDAIQMDIKSQAEADAIARIEGQRNVARGELVAQILQSIGNHRQIGELELRLATTFADISRRSLTDDILGHEYIEMLKALAEGKGTNIFNAMLASPPVDPGTMLSDLHLQNSGQPRNGHS